MARKKKAEIFFCDIQSRGQKGRKVIEIPKKIRDNFDVSEHVKVIIKVV